jgi:putative transposase
MKFDPQKHHRRSIRLKGYDYAQPGAYFVTLCAWQREALFGEVVGGKVWMNAAGRIIEAEWERMPHQFPNISLGAFVVMPNHFHGIIMNSESGVGATHTLIPGATGDHSPMPNEPVENRGGSPNPASIQPLERENRATRHAPIESEAGNPYEDITPGQNLDGSPLRVRNGPVPGSLGAMIGQFKSRATKRIWKLPGYTHTPVWQRNYYEHIIRNETELKKIWDYIDTNPERWMDDQLHPAAETNPFNQDEPHG